MQPKKIMAFGEILWDKLPSGRVLGGAPFNFAYRMFERGEFVVMVSRVGLDALGQEVLGWAYGIGMRTYHIQGDGILPTGTVEVTLDERKQPDYYIVPNVAFDYIQPDVEFGPFAAEADCVYFGTLAQRNETSRRTLMQILNSTQDGFKLLDLNLRKDCYTEPIVAESLNHANILKMNEDEALVLSEMFNMNTDSLIEIGHYCLANWALRICLITLGERGVMAFSSKDIQVYAPGYQIELVDTCGAGDAFTAGFLYKFLRRERFIECCIYGNALGALAASQAGASKPISDEQVASFLEVPPPSHFDERFMEWYEPENDEEE